MLKGILEKIDEQAINESTTAVIIVQTGDDKYSMSYLQADGYIDGAGKTLRKHFNDPKKARKLVAKSGEIRGINGDDIEFYNDKKMLLKDKSEKEIIKAIWKYGPNYMYFYDKSEKGWLMTTGSSGARDLLDINKTV